MEAAARSGGAQFEMGCEAVRVEVLAYPPPAPAGVSAAAESSAPQNSAAEVAVTARDGRVFRASQCVLAAPVAALSAVEFVPQLSPEKRRAIAEIPMGSIAKVSFVVDGARWLDGKCSGGIAVTGLPPSANAYTAAGGRSRSSSGGDATCVVTVYAVGDAAEHIAQLQHDQRICAAAEAVSASPATKEDGAESALREPEHVTEGAAKVWREDTSSKGAYAFFRPGQIAVRGVAGLLCVCGCELPRRDPRGVLSCFTTTQAGLPRALRAAEHGGALRFAGEHTSVFQGYMNGAIESGHRVAWEVFRAAQKAGSAAAVEPSVAAVAEGRVTAAAAAAERPSQQEALAAAAGQTGGSK